MTRAAAVATLLVPLFAVACREPEHLGVVRTPPLTVASAASGEASRPAGRPVDAAFVELSPAGVALALASSCDEAFVAVARGHATIARTSSAPAAFTPLSLSEGDVARVWGAPADLQVTGGGLALRVSTRPGPSPCPPSTEPPLLQSLVARGSDAAPLTWARGTMTAHLDLEKPASPNLYVGRLAGTAKVPEHTHPGAWEILCAVEGSGTLLLAGQSRHVGPRDVVFVPPDTPHAWTPDDGVKLVAFQMYSPPGAEQRFKALAAPPKE